MLSERERRTLEQIERGLTVDSPELAHQMRRPTGWPVRRIRLAHDVVAVVAALLAVVCLLAGAWLAGTVAALFAMDVVLVRYLRYSNEANLGPNSENPL
jgi:hypothetical protein